MKNKEKYLDVVKTTEGLIKRTDWRIKENANIPYSFSNVFFRVSGDVISKFMLSKIYPTKIAKAHTNGDLHIHNLYMGLNAYCCGWDLKLLLLQGLGKLPGRVATIPPKHFSTALHHVLNFVGIITGEWAGAQAFNSFDTLLAPFIKKDNLSYKQIKQVVQEFVFGLNVTTRWASQSPFSNISFDWKVPEDLAKERVILGGKSVENTYSDYQAEMDMINKAFIEIMLQGDAIGRVFTFPIPSYNITKDFDWNSENADLLFEMAAKYGIPYFSNFVNSELNPSDIRSMCLHPDELILVKNAGKIKKMTMRELVKIGKVGWKRNKENIKVLSLNTKTYKIEWVRIKNFLKVIKNGIIEITTRDGKCMKLSTNHPVAVYTKEGIKTKLAKNINLNDILLTTRSAFNVLSNQKQYVGKFKLDESLAFLIGFFIADGNYLYDSRKQYSSYRKERGLQFSFHDENSKIIEKIKNIIKKKFNYNLKFKKDKRYKHSLLAYFWNVEVARELSKNGIKKYGGVPTQIFNSSKEIIESFLKGVYVGNGYEKGKEIHINDKELAHDLVLLYILVGMPITVNYKKNSQRIRLQHTFGRGSKGNIVNDILYNRVPQFVVKTGRDKPFYEKNHMVCLSSLEKHNAHTEESKKILKGNFALVKVRNIKYVDKKRQDFYDIELEKNNYFVHSLGQITHNCCRLRLDIRQLQRNITGGLFGSSNLTGSIGVVTINMPRLGFISKNENQFFERLEELMETASQSLEIKRKMLNENMKKGLLPYTKAYLGTFKNHFSTIGLIGMNEACLNMLDVDIADKDAQNFAIKTLKFMLKKLGEFQRKTGNLYNLEATPAEGTSYRLASMDKKMYPKIKTAGKKVPYYTNSTWLPVNKTNDLAFAIRHQEPLQSLYTGGTVLHIFLGERIGTAQACKQLVRQVLEKSVLPYITITPTYSICPSHGYLNGEHSKCPICKTPCEVYSRIVGYYRPKNQWNIGKQEEFKQRLGYKEKVKL